MKALTAVLPLLLAARAFAGDASTDGATADEAAPAVHRYLIERTFPAGALDGLDAAAKARVNENNATVGVHWVKSFANEDRTKTFCIYEGPSEEAIRRSADLNNLPVDSITEVPVDLTP
jgi:predicted dinucleotide-utilizing enzyme